MHDRSRFAAALVGSVALAVVGMGAPASAADPPVTLRLALADLEGGPEGTAVLDLVEQVGALADGITIEPVFGAQGDVAIPGYQVVAQKVVDGEFEMGLIPSRVWNDEGVTSLQALQAPFLIGDDAIAVAVARSDLAPRMLEGLSAAGLVGLALWPEEMRHPFAFDACHAQPFLAPADFGGATFASFTSTVSHDLLATLGAKPTDTGNGPNDACEVDAAEGAYNRRAWDPSELTATGNVTFFPRYDVLVIDDAAWDRLTDAQRSGLREAAAAAAGQVMDARVSDADQGAGWCTDGGHVVLASDAQVAALEAATRPVYERLEADPLTKEVIAAIRELKAGLEPAPAAAACERPAAAAPAPSVNDPNASAGLPPAGVYRATITADELEAKGVSHEDAVNNDGLATWTIQDGKGSMDMNDGFGACGQAFEMHGSAVSVSPDGTGGCTTSESYDITWTLEGDELIVTLVTARLNGVEDPYLSTFGKAFYGRSWTKIE